MVDLWCLCEITESNKQIGQLKKVYFMYIVNIRLYDEALVQAFMP